MLMEHMSFKEIVQKLDTKLNDKYGEYSKYHEELAAFADRALDGAELAKANEILEAIQDSFKELYEVYHWILFRSQYASNAVTSYNEFIDKLKQAGATEAVQGEA
jgi:hypothetical protein